MMQEDYMPKLLLLEDERNVGLTLLERLQKEKFEVSWVQSCAEAKRVLSDKVFDLALLDVGLPDGLGFDLAKSLKSMHPGTAILFLTAFNNPEDRVQGLEMGAEDYIAKPFHFKELVLRIRNGLKRSQNVENPIQVGRAKIYFKKFEIHTDGQVGLLSAKEIALLKLLVDRRGCVVSRDEILNYAWSEDDYPTPRTVDNFILRLRKWVEECPENPKVIRSIRGVGYQLV
jgi:DNA-binding response OmpR family regulator